MLMFNTCLKVPAIGRCAKLCFNSSITAILTPVKPQTIIFRNASMEQHFLFKPNHYWDRIPEHFTMIYKCRIRRYIQALQVVPFMFGAFWVYYGINFDKVNSFVPTNERIAAITTLGLITAIAVYFALKASRYPLGIYHHNGHFIAVRRSFLGRLKQLHYNLGDVSCKLKKGGDYQKTCDVTIFKTKFHLVAADFISPIYYNMHLGDGTFPYTDTSTKVLGD